MIEQKIIKLLSGAAQFYKGTNYKIDGTVPLIALLEFSFRRFISLIRCLLCGVVLSLNPKKLIFVESNVQLKNRSMISFGKRVSLGRGVMIDGLSKEGIKIEDGVSIGSSCCIRATVGISKIGKGVRIGKNSGIDSFSFIGAAGGVDIGENVIIGIRANFHAEEHIFDSTELPIRLQGTTRKGIIIDDDCWIGANVTFLDGSHVGRGCVIGAGSIVNGYIPPYSVAVGIPAKVIKTRKHRD